MRRQGFSLIELLVVIAIIGLLATMGVVSFSTSREKARIAKGVSFSGQILRTTGDELVGRWDFDECSGTSAVDSGGSNNNGTFSGTLAWSTATPGNQGCSLTFNGVDSKISANISSLGAIQTKTLWFYATDVTANRYIFDEGGNNNFMRVLAGKFTNGTSASYYWNSNKNIVVGKWYFVASVYDGTKLYTYIDGSLDRADIAGAQVPTAALSIGNYSGGGPFFFAGNIDDVRVYNRALSSRDIHRLYVESRPRYFAKR